MRRMGRPGLVGTMARTAVIAGTATAVSGGVARRQQARTQEGQDAKQQQEWQQQQEWAAQQQAATAGTPAEGEKSVIDQIKELAELKDQGILTEEEFTAQKTKLLATT